MDYKIKKRIVNSNWFIIPYNVLKLLRPLRYAIFFLQKRSQTPHATQNSIQDCATTTDDDEVDDEMCTHCK